jgi:hypothetical protein
MGSRDAVLAVGRRRHRYRHRLGQRDQRRPGPRRPHATAGHDDRAPRRQQRPQGRVEIGVVRGRTERRHRGEARLDPGPDARLLDVELPFVALHLEVNRSRPAGHGHPERLPQHVREAVGMIDRAVELGDLIEGRQVVDLLVHVAELGRRQPAAGQREHR